MKEFYIKNKKINKHDGPKIDYMSRAPLIWDSMSFYVNYKLS